MKQPFGRCANPPRTLAADLGLSPRRAIYSVVGGDQPQALVSEFAEELHAGRARGVLITGSEAIAAMKTARKKRLSLDWTRSAEGEQEDRGFGTDLLTAYELKNGLGYPTWIYPLFDQALRGRLGLSQEDYRRRMSELLAPFSQVAAQNPYSQFPEERSAQFLETHSSENYPIADPYLKWHVAQDAVNQGAAVIMTTVGQARAIGVPEEKWVYLHGYAKAHDKPVSQRPDYSRSQAINLVLRRTLESSKLEVADLDLFDIYSCFPCVVQLAAEVLGVDWREKVLTVTGGLPFFGGPGNNYSLHAICSMADQLRDAPGSFGLVLANGGFMSKEAAGVYSTTPPTDWQPVSSADIQAEIDAVPPVPLVAGDIEGEVETYTVVYGRYGPERACMVVREGDRRALARAPSGHRAMVRSILNGEDPLGQTVRVRARDGANYLVPRDTIYAVGKQGFLQRKFEFASVEKRGHILEVTLNRPEAMNALHAAAHYELTEIFDAFEQDRDLWVGIITGQGDRAFCAGNDLRATASGGDMSMPRSGFAGLCSRLDRGKPLIAAVNGVAMGGGLEIILACDLAIADPSAKMALPEVKVGLFAAAGGVQRLSRQIGRKAAMELLLTGRHIDAETALGLGLINYVSAPGQSLPEARALAEEICKVSPSSVRATKLVLNHLETTEGLAESLKYGGKVIRDLLRTNDAREGPRAFAEKRAPKWTNS
ncbi:MAG: enoyl-CoA hydratase-related protein [Hyphomonadaceae bacterium]|nr:enoyl-CoA hydratase-related protein [Hyphomonadaceae bacterium]